MQSFSKVEGIKFWRVTHVHVQKSAAQILRNLISKEWEL